MSGDVRQGDVWWARLDPVEGSEQAKTRPVLVISIDQINRAPADLAIVCPITTTPRPAAVRIELSGGRGNRIGYVEPYQVRTLSQSRLERRVAVAPGDVLSEVSARLALFTRPAARA